MPLRLSPPRPDHTAPVTTVLTLPTGYNYSAFCCSPFSPSLSLPLSQLDWVLTPRSRRRAAGPLLCVHNVLNATLHCGSEQVGGGDAKGGKGREGKEGGVTHWMPRPLGWRGGGGGGPAAQQPTYLLLPFSLSMTSFLSHFLSLSLSVPGLQAECSSQCHHCLVPLTAGGGMLQSWPLRKRGGGEWKQKIE